MPDRGCSIQINGVKTTIDTWRAHRQDEVQDGER